MKLNNSSRTASNGVIMNTSKNPVIIEITELWEINPIRIINEYIVANEKVSQKIEYKKGICQKPDLIDKINHTIPIRYSRLTKIKRTPPVNFPSIIAPRDIGLESNTSIFPFSTIEGMNEETAIRQNVIIIKYEKFRTRTWKPTTISRTASSPEAPNIDIIPSTESRFTMKRNDNIIKVDIIVNPRNIFFAIASLNVPVIIAMNCVNLPSPFLHQ